MFGSETFGGCKTALRKLQHLATLYSCLETDDLPDYPDSKNTGCSMRMC